MKFVGLQTALLSLVFVGFTAGAMAEADFKIGYVDMQKAIQSTTAGKTAKKNLETEFNKRKKELEKKEGDIKKMNEDFEKKKLVLSDEVKQQKANEIRTEMMKYQELVGKSQLEIQKKERDLTMPIVKKLREILEGIAKNENYTMILEKSEQSVLYAKKEIDLTDRLIKDFEKAK
ncbi:MAG: OmpH family outer membrane protein [Bdellovibrionaceae bacterium]|nr:OmpH family outer membrane protein [Bdellovibrionales bacterium]MCB9085897.1 OmpH family outer membrane protein [Pseudobdellovibrionaceae bacterium]